MDDKQKPSYATIHIRKPRIPWLVSAALILLIVGVIGMLGWQEYERWQAQMRDISAELEAAEEKIAERDSLIRRAESSLRETENRLQEAQTALSATAAQLDEAEQKLDKSPPWQLEEPVGFMVSSYDVITHRRTLEAITCVGMPQGYLTHVYYHSVDQRTIDDLIQSDEYELVGKDEWSAMWEEDGYDDEDSDDYYMNRQVLDKTPFRWLSWKDWIDNSWNWEGHLRNYCDNMAKP